MNLICSFSNKKIEENETCFIFFIEPQDVLKSGTSLDPYDYFKHIDNDVLFIEGSYNGYGSFTVNDKTKLNSLVNSINNIVSNDNISNNNDDDDIVIIREDEDNSTINIDDNISSNKLNWDNICEKSYTGFLNNISMFVVKKDTCFKSISNLKNKFMKDINLVYKDKSKSIESRLISIENMLPESICDIFLTDINVNHIAEKLAFHKYMLDNNIRVFPSISS